MAATQRAPEKYDRVFLEGLVDQYLEALVAHNPAGAPIAKRVKFTENAQAMPVGEGLWATASDNTTYRLYACDPQAGQVGFFGVMKENGSPVILSLRLKVDKKLITEIETIVTRAGGGPPQGDGRSPFENLIKPNPVYLEALAPSERVSRKEMIRISDLYFEGIVKDDGDIVPFSDDCYRIENGMYTANDPNAKPFPGTDFNPGILNCREQFNSGFFAYIAEIYDRRYAVIDEERGLSWGMFMFCHPGNIESGVSKDGKVVKMMEAARRPMNVIVAELFKIKNGKICAIEANMTALPYRSKSGWEK